MTWPLDYPRAHRTPSLTRSRRGSCDGVLNHRTCPIYGVEDGRLRGRPPQALEWSGRGETLAERLIADRTRSRSARGSNDAPGPVRYATGIQIPEASDRPQIADALDAEHEKGTSTRPQTGQRPAHEGRRREGHDSSRESCGRTKVRPQEDDASLRSPAARGDDCLHRGY